MGSFLLLAVRQPYVQHGYPLVILNKEIDKACTLGLEGPHGAVDDSLVGLVQTSRLYHLILVLYEKLHSLDRSGRCF